MPCNALIVLNILHDPGKGSAPVQIVKLPVAVEREADIDPAVLKEPPVIIRKPHRAVGNRIDADQWTSVKILYV